MARRGKKYQDSPKLVDRSKLYDVRDALKLIGRIAKANFGETVELAVRPGVDPRHADQQVRGTVVLPYGAGEANRVLVLTKGDKIKKAEAVGADYVGSQEYVNKVQSKNWFKFDTVAATPDMMGVVGHIGHVLGPKDLIPDPKPGTVTFDLTKAVEDIKAGKVEYRVDKTAIINVPIGKVFFGPDKLRESFEAFVTEVIKTRPAAAEGKYLKSITVPTTMGPEIKINRQKLMED